MSITEDAVELCSYQPTGGPHALFRLPEQKEWWSRKVSDRVRGKEQPRPDDRLYRCRQCGFAISSRQARLKVCGSTTHRFVNPVGIHFHILCFSSAPGIFNHGEFTSQFSWFPDYQWCYSHCANCFTHLGWFYRKDRDGFYGLIIDKLKESPSA